MAANRLCQPWSRTEINAVEFLYLAGWRWPSITAHVNALGGHDRSDEAVRAKGRQIGITQGVPKGHRPIEHLRYIVRGEV